MLTGGTHRWAQKASGDEVIGPRSNTAKRQASFFASPRIGGDILAGPVVELVRQAAEARARQVQKLADQGGRLVRSRGDRRIADRRLSCLVSWSPANTVLPLLFKRPVCW